MKSDIKFEKMITINYWYSLLCRKHVLLTRTQCPLCNYTTNPKTQDLQWIVRGRMIFLISPISQALSTYLTECSFIYIVIGLTECSFIQIVICQFQMPKSTEVTTVDRLEFQPRISAAKFLIIIYSKQYIWFHSPSGEDNMVPQSQWRTEEPKRFHNHSGGLRNQNDSTIIVED